MLRDRSGSCESPSRPGEDKEDEFSTPERDPPARTPGLSQSTSSNVGKLMKPLNFVDVTGDVNHPLSSVKGEETQSEQNEKEVTDPQSSLLSKLVFWGRSLSFTPSSASSSSSSAEPLCFDENKADPIPFTRASSKLPGPEARQKSLLTDEASYNSIENLYGAHINTRNANRDSSLYRVDSMNSTRTDSSDGSSSHSGSSSQKTPSLFDETVDDVLDVMFGIRPASSLSQRVLSPGAPGTRSGSAPVEIEMQVLRHDGTPQLIPVRPLYTSHFDMSGASEIYNDLLHEAYYYDQIDQDAAAAASEVNVGSASATNTPDRPKGRKSTGMDNVHISPRYLRSPRSQQPASIAEEPEGESGGSEGDSDHDAAAQEPVENANGAGGGSSGSVSVPGAFPRTVSWGTGSNKSGASEGGPSPKSSDTTAFPRRTSFRTNSFGFGSTANGGSGSGSGGLSRRPSENAFPRVMSLRADSETGYGSGSERGGGLARRPSETPAFPRTLSFRVNSGTAGNDFSPNNASPSTAASTDTPSFSELFAMVRAGTVPLPTLVFLLVEKVHKIRYLLIDQQQDERFYEAIRIQPFTAGSYLRGMMIGGMSNMFFLTVTLVYWNNTVTNSGSGESGNVELCTPVSVNEHIIEWVLFVWLVLIVMLHYVQLPIRVSIHFKCFTSSRTVEVDDAVATLRSLFISDAWLINRAIGWATDVLSVGLLLFGELYNWWHCYYTELPGSGMASGPLSPVIASFTCTIVLAFVTRLLIALVYCAAMHDPDVLAEAKKRGLSKWDLEILPTFIYSPTTDVSNSEGCSICLTNFDKGEELISLPCDKRHSFHAECIRQWLHRQNSCPLCQKHV